MFISPGAAFTAGSSSSAINHDAIIEEEGANEEADFVGGAAHVEQRSACGDERAVLRDFVAAHTGRLRRSRHALCNEDHAEGWLHPRQLNLCTT